MKWLENCTLVRGPKLSPRAYGKGLPGLPGKALAIGHNTPSDMFDNYWLQLAIRNLDFQRTLIYSFYLLISFTSCLWKCVFCLFWRGPHWKQVDYLGVRLLWAILRFKRLHHCCILLFIEINSFIHLKNIFFLLSFVFLSLNEWMNLFR